MAEEVTVSAAPEASARRKYPGMSPLQAGLLYGGAASTVMGPLGLLVGLGSGIAASRMRSSWLDDEAKYQKNARSEYQGLNQEIEGELRVADPDEARYLQHAKRLAADGWYRLQSGDPTGRELIEQSNELTRSVMTADMQARKQRESEVASMQRGLVTTAANAYREEYQANMKMFEEVDQQTSRVLDLVNSEGFDPNKPFNKAALTDLLSVGVSGLYKDDPGGLASLASAVPVIGKYLEGGVQWQKAEDYKLTPDDYNRIAYELKKSNERRANEKMQSLGEQANTLDSFARGQGMIGEDFSIGDYISGGIKDLKMNPMPKMKAPARQPETKYRYNDPVSRGARGIERWMNNRKSTRPTN